MIDGLDVEAAELPLDHMQQHLEKAIGLLTGRPKNCARNAFRCLRRAWSLRAMDPEMSIFRAITAEEEAATALMFALKHRRYPGSERLLPRDHAHKAAWVPFIEAIGKMMSESGVPAGQILLKAEDSPRIDIRIPAEALGIDGAEGRHLMPDEPLNLIIRTGTSARDVSVTTFAAEVEAWAAARGTSDIRLWISETANLRNQVLYAADGGIPTANDPTKFILERRRRVQVLLMVTIAVLQADTPQPLAAQALRGFLKLMRNIDETGFDFDGAETPGDFRILTDLDPVGGRPRTRFEEERRFTFRSTFTHAWGWGQTLNDWMRLMSAPRRPDGT